MDKQEAKPAELDESTLHKLQSFEEALCDSTGSNIVLVAYQAKTEKSEK
ncbi:hypothetical protein [Paenibacillus selenitireducens]|nr:hypothetical protein [Paenibacillus selenitireducens]